MLQASNNNQPAKHCEEGFVNRA